MKNIIALVLLVCSALLIMYPHYFVVRAIDSGYSWTISALSHWILLLIISLLFVLLVQLKIKKVWVILIKIVVPITILGVYFAQNPIYQGDYIKVDTELNISDNSVLTTISKTNPDFNGIVCLASPGCGFCKEATHTRLKRIKMRSDIDVAVFLAADDSSAIDFYISETDAPELEYFLVEEQEGMNELTQGRYPTFIYIKDNKIAYKWSNDNLGYPALDWIESGLK